MTYTQEACRSRWTEVLAPQTGDLRQDLVLELAAYFGATVPEVERQLADATEQFTREWNERVHDPADERAVTRFYNESTTELFDLARWHAEDPIHYRTLMCLDVATTRPGRRMLDYGSGIGSDALVFAAAGFHVTLADISEPLLAFARWRLQRRGFDVEAIDLKRARPPRGRFDVTLCFDVLEHIHRPLRTVGTIQRAMTPGGLLFVHAPFGEDPIRPMHVVHSDVITPRMRSVGFLWREDLERPFPEWLWHPRVYEAFALSAFDRIGYRMYDTWMKGPLGDAVAAVYRQLRGRRAAPLSANRDAV